MVLSCQLWSIGRLHEHLDRICWRFGGHSWSFEEYFLKLLAFLELLSTQRSFQKFLSTLRAFVGDPERLRTLESI